MPPIAAACDAERAACKWCSYVLMVKSRALLGDARQQQAKEKRSEKAAREEKGRRETGTTRKAKEKVEMYSHFVHLVRRQYRFWERSYGVHRLHLRVGLL